MANNFNQSNTGTNIEFNLFYDTDLASMYYDEFVDGADGTDVLRFGNRQTDYMVVCDDKDAPYYKKSQLSKMKKCDLADLYEHYDIGWFTDNFTKNELIDDLLYVTIEQHYDAYFANTNWHELECDFISRGYSQGDAVKFKNLSSNTYSRQYIDNLLWDCPISMIFDVNGDTICYIDELLPDVYNFDEKLFLTNLENTIKDKEWKNEALEFVKDNLEIQYL